MPNRIFAPLFCSFFLAPVLAEALDLFSAPKNPMIG